MRFLRVIGVLSAMSLAVGCGGHDCHAFNDAICNRTSQCGFGVCNVDSCPGNEKVDFSACIDATRASSCGNVVDTAFSCHVVQGGLKAGGNPSVAE